MQSLLKLIAEQIILGIIEDIQILGLGEISAKVDSGNTSHNVIHGSNINHKSNGTITFDTAGKTIEKRVQDRITVNVGANMTEERPVVLFDVIVRGKEYKDIPFSIGNRKSNTEKILLGVDFLNLIGALIDPSSTD